MEIFLITTLIIIVIALLLFWFALTYNKFQGLIVKTNEAEANIDAILRKRFDLLNKSINIIKANTDIDKEILEFIVKLRSKKISNFDLDRQLYDAINEFNYYKEIYPELNSVDAFSKINISLDESEYEMTALRKYYNDTITEYNKLIRKFPSNIVGIVLRYKEKTYYDGKNMNDDITNDFKL
ncbi:MAG: LemA family protein [Bacilli bacterium]|nr:LemA family protein [Bacilli bacterium]